MRLTGYTIIFLAAFSVGTVIFINVKDQDDPVYNKVVNIGEAASSKVISTLKSELSAKIKTQGVAGALTTCNTKALELTDSIQKALSNGILIKRTSLRTRNIVNSPDEDERYVLEWFETKQENAGVVPSNYIEKKNYGVYEYYNYYKPLIIEGMCLNCHGYPSEMEKDVVETINKLYPNDRAMGYKKGELRGVIHVSIPATLVE